MMKYCYETYKSCWYAEEIIAYASNVFWTQHQQKILYNRKCVGTQHSLYKCRTIEAMMWEMNHDIKMQVKHCMKWHGKNTWRPLDSCQTVFYIVKRSIAA